MMMVGDAGEKTILTHIVDSIGPLKAVHYLEGRGYDSFCEGRYKYWNIGYYV